jgi:hypothetical protein
LPRAKRGGFLEYKFIINPDMPLVDRSQILKALQSEGVACGADRYGRLHEVRVFRRGGPIVVGMLTDNLADGPIQPPLTNLEAIRDRVFSLPAYADVSTEFIRQCGAAIRKVAKHFAE